ncbi:uncharacterized mitochondrial protein AtMg00810-like [Solanum verrucosum]|uniref:uncharacterized mitochondrial protein AtMg00810-like n=1 Tax=Solanum verrucosum TaxID=315347 RepID=UPI0020D1ABBF|nr:uncharacterized mitochondrial protein AtMg00810-like [Solanum verrucosum]
MGLSGAKPVNTPLDPNLRLTSIEYNSCVQEANTTSSDKPLEDIDRYQRLVGRLLYLTMTMVDISFAVQVLSQYMHTPKESHMEVALRVVKYIKSAPGFGLFMPSQDSNQLIVYCDSDCSTCLQTRRSVTRYLVKFGNALVSWKAKKQETVA